MVVAARGQETSMSCAGRRSLSIEQNFLPKESSHYKFQPAAVAGLSTVHEVPGIYEKSTRNI